MHSFHAICKLILEHRGYWVRTDVKVDVEKNDKKALKKDSMPRPDIDLVAYRPGELVLWEAKSYLYSSGVKLDLLSELDDQRDGVYKLLTWEAYRDVVVKRLVERWGGKGLIDKNPKVSFGIIAGNIQGDPSGDSIRERFRTQGKDWIVISPNEIKAELAKISDEGYQDDVVIMTSKIFQ